MTPRLRTGLIVAFALLLVVAVLGWMRTPSAANASYGTYSPQAAAVPPNGVAAPGAPGYDQYAQPAGANGTATSPAYPNPAASPYPAAAYSPQYPDSAGASSEPEGDLPEYAFPRCVRTIRAAPQPAPYGDADRNSVDQQAYPAAPPPAYAPAPGTRYMERRPAHHRRSTRTSAEIVAGSAGVGAAVGAIAGGGKGAGIGALAGGAGGFVYDRLTRNH